MLLISSRRSVVSKLHSAELFSIKNCTVGRFKGDAVMKSNSDRLSGSSVESTSKTGLPGDPFKHATSLCCLEQSKCVVHRAEVGH
jgi:hypothetical protein